MQVTINPGKINGTIIAPASKSITQRAYAGALLHKGKTIINNAGHSEDDKTSLQIIQNLGAKLICDNSLINKDCFNAIEIQSNGILPKEDIINCGESGLAARLFTPIAALSGKKIKIEAIGSLLRRPVGELEKILSKLGVSFTNFNGYLPFILNGKLTPKDITINASESSQYLTGLLFALSYGITQPVTICVTDLESKPYIDITLEILRMFGKPIQNNNYKEFIIDPTQFTLNNIKSINIEGDWSSAAFFLVAGAIAGQITVKNIQTNSKQADKAIIQILNDTGAIVTESDSYITVKQATLRYFEYDATHTPDLFPILSILAACCQGESSIRGVHRLFNKESNRVESITEMLGNFNVPFCVEDDILSITGVNKLQGTVIESYNDHRIVMAAAIGALRAGSRVDINNTSAVNKSYPDFFKDLQSLIDIN